jgi:O-acetyl-ADP-ribose deacetylase (regulator of RNase III)
MTSDIPIAISSFEGEIGDMKVRLVHGDLTREKLASVMIPQFADRGSDGGLALAFSQAFGHDISKDYRSYLELRKRPLDYSALVCVPDKESGRWLLHAATVRSGTERAFETVGRAVQNALNFASENNLRSVGIPALATGPEGELTNKQSALAILNAIHKFSAVHRRKSYPRLEITIGLWDWKSGQKFRAFRQELLSRRFENVQPELGQRVHDPAHYAHAQRQKGRNAAVIFYNGAVLEDATQVAEILPFRPRKRLPEGNVYYLRRPKDPEPS